MADGLPEGLVTNTEAISGDIQGVDRIAAEDLAHLWRVYTTNKNLLANDVGRRLENLFWRIWSNGEIRSTIRGNNIAAIFLAISDGDAIIRTTPTSSPRSSRLIPSPRPLNCQETPTPGRQANVSSLDLLTSPEEGQSSEDEATKTIERSSRASAPPNPPTIEEEKGRRRGSSRPPPILKKTGTESTRQESKTTRILTPDSTIPRRTSGEEGPSSRGPSAISFDLGSRRGRGSDSALADRSKPSVYDLASRSAAASHASSSLSRGTPLEPSRSTSSSGKGKKKAAFIAGSASSKRRPAVARRKSSQSSSSNTVTQSSSSNTSKAPSPKSGQPSTPQSSLSSTVKPSQVISDRRRSSLAAPPEPRSTPAASAISTIPSARSGRPTSRSASPVSTGPFHRPTRDHLPDISGAEPRSHVAGGPQQDWLVDKDFRTRFLTGALASRSNSTVKLSTSLEAGGTMASSAYSPRPDKGKGKAKQMDSPEQTKPTISDISATTADDENDEDDEGITMQLPRTKSQLTLLLEKDRRKEHEKRRREGGKGHGRGS